MDARSRRRSLLRERGVLGLGLLCAAILVVAASTPGSDPETGARTALAQLGARTEQAVVAEWNGMLRDAAPPAPAASDEFVFEGVSALGFPTVFVDPVERAADDDPACAALLAEAERTSALSGDFAAAQQLVDEALAKRPSARQRSIARRIRAQLAVLQDDVVELRGTLETAFEERESGDDDALLRTLLVAARVEGARDVLAANARLADECARRWCGSWMREHRMRVERRAGAGVWYSVDGLEPLAAVCERLAELPRTAALERTRADAVPFARLCALDAFVAESIGAWPQGAWPETWNVVPLGADFLVRTGAVNGPWRGFFVARADLEGALRERLSRAELLPEGVELDFDGRHGELGPALRERTALLGHELGFVLRHRDPDALVRAETRKLLGLRIALFVMAAFAGGAGLAMSRALARERRLAELKATFVANVSHELRTPLASILLMAENLEDGRTRDPAAQARYHALIRREAVRLAQLVDDVLDFSRLERGKHLELELEELDPRPLLEAWSAELRSWASEHGLELELDIGALPPSVALDREALRRALFNLLDNARKHSGSREIRCSASLEPDARADAPALVLAVADRGRGIPEKRRASVFEPFERLDEGPDAAPGAGLGLAIVKEIVLAHGGTIRVRDPESGQGCVFEIRLPVSRDAVAREAVSRERDVHDGAGGDA